MTPRFPDASGSNDRLKFNWRGMVRNNVGLKVTAALITLVLWLTVNSQPVAETTFRQQLDFQHVPAGLTITDQDTQNIQITVRGPSDALTRIRAGESRLDTVIDLSDFKNSPGKRIIGLTSENISVPRGVEVLEIKPSHIALTLSPFITKSVPIEAVTDGQPKAGFTFAGCDVQPKVVQIKGPEALVTKTSSVHTETITLSGHDKDFDVLVSVDTGDPAVDLVQRGDQATVTVHVHVSPSSQSAAP